VLKQNGLHAENFIFNCYYIYAFKLANFK